MGKRNNENEYVNINRTKGQTDRDSERQTDRRQRKEQREKKWGRGKIIKIENKI